MPGGNSCSYFGVIKCAYTGSSKLAPALAHLIAFIVNFHAALGAAPLRMKARWFRACGTPPSADGIRALRSACGMSTLPLRSVLDKRHWRLAPRAHTVLSANVRASGQASLPVCASACRAFIVNFHAALGAAPPRMKARIAPCLRHSRNPAPKYSDFPLPTAARPHTLGLSNVQTQGQVNLPLRLPT